MIFSDIMAATADVNALIEDFQQLPVETANGRAEHGDFDMCIKHMPNDVAYHFPEFPAKFGLPSLKKYQSQMIHQMRAHENIESWPAPPPYSRMYNTHTIVHMPTGSGKTIVGLQMCYLQKYPTHIDTSSTFECVGSSAPNGGACICFTANSENFPNKDSTLIVVPPHLVQHWSDCATHVFKLKSGNEFVVKTDLKAPKSVKMPKKRKTPTLVECTDESTIEEEIPMCFIVAATKVNMMHMCKTMWRRIIIDEPELIPKAVPIPLAYHTFMLTASTDELFKTTTCCVSAFVKHVKEFDKKVVKDNLDFIAKMTISLDRSYYDTFQRHKMTSMFDVVSGAKTLNDLVRKIPNGSSMEVTLALNMDDYSKVASFLHLSDEPVNDLDDFCDLINQNVKKVADSMKDVLTASQNTEMLKNLEFLRRDIDKIKDEDKLIVGASAKIKKLMQHLRNVSEEKTLILCQYGATFVKNALEDESIPYVDLSEIMKPSITDPSPTSEQVARLLNQARNGSKNIVLVNPKYYGRGLDMQFAKHMFVLHSIAEHVVTQWTGRAFRQNRSDDLIVTYIYTDCEPPMDVDESEESI